MHLSTLYIDKDGFLMDGEPSKASSMVEGIRLLPVNFNNWDYELVFINDLDQICGGSVRIIQDKYYPGLKYGIEKLKSIK